jgi:ABC-type dipeptide/oligopeptide/nickel transport system permease subunit
MSRIATGLFVILVLVAPLIAPYDPMRTEPANQLQPPSRSHLLGTDLLGRDVLSRALYGGQRTLLIAAAATVIALVPGVALGLISGLGSRWLDSGIQVLVSGVLAFPGLMLALVVLTVVGAGALPLATGVMQIAPCARIVRAAVLDVRSQPFIQAADALGASPIRLVFFHLLPNIQAILLAYTVVIFSVSVLNNAALSFLGLGGDPGVPDWGTMLMDGRTAFRAAPWIGLAPGIGITATVLLLNRLTRNLNQHI